MRARKSITAVALLTAAVSAACGSAQTGSAPTSPAGETALSAAQPSSNAASNTAPVEPKYKPMTWAKSKSDPSETATADLPVGWNQDKELKYGTELVDPSGKVRLKVDFTPVLAEEGADSDPRTAADAELAKAKSTAGFRLVSDKNVPHKDGANEMVEIIYRSTRDGQETESTYRFGGLFGGDGGLPTLNFVIGASYPAADQSVGRKVVATISGSVTYAP